MYIHIHIHGYTYIYIYIFIYICMYIHVHVYDLYTSSFLLIFTVLTRNQVVNIAVVARQIASGIMKPISKFTLKLVINYQINFADVTFLKDFIHFSLFLGFSRKHKEGDKISFRFCYIFCTKF